MNLWFEKNFSWGSLSTGGAAVFWAVDFFSTTYFGEIIFFEVSKGPNFQNPLYSHESGTIFLF
jgi:hypothetical protein